MREEKSFCRTCIAQCGLVVGISDDGRIVKVRGDREHPISAGYACFKGLQAPGAHYSPSRLLQSLKRTPDGDFVPIPVEQLFDEIAQKLTAIRRRGGADAIGLFRGTAAFHNSTAFGIHAGFMAALGSSSQFTTLTIDQSAKAIAACRIGFWHAGKHHIDQSDVAMLFGCNPLVSHSTGGFLVSDPVKRVRKAVERGLKLIVVDPRKTETAHFAALHLQPYPGEDVSIAAGLLRIILSEGWHDAKFCEQYVDGLARLIEAVTPFEPEMVAARAGVTIDQLRGAAKLFARDSKRGGVVTGTGPNMASRSNLAEHLIQCIEIVCGRFKRAGDEMPNADPLSPQQDWHAEVAPSFRPWEAVTPSRIRGVGNLFGEKLTGTLAEEILTPGPGQIRALIVDGANIGNSVPGKQDIIAALRDLELLVVIDPHLTTTARLADYVIAPSLQFERADITITLNTQLHADSWAQYTPALVPPPTGSEAVEDWYVFWSLAKRMGLELSYRGNQVNMESPPTTQDLLAFGLSGSALSLDDFIARPGHVVVNPTGPIIVKPARSGHSARFQLDGDSVLDELALVARETIQPRYGSRYPYRLIARRMRDLNGSIGMQTPEVRRRNPFNPLHMHPADMEIMGLTTDDEVDMLSEDGQIRALVRPDDTLRRGVASMSHNWGGAENRPEDYLTDGASTNALIRTMRNYEELNAMPRMSGIPIDIRPARTRDGVKSMKSAAMEDMA